MKIFADQVEYREWVEQIAGSVEQVGSVRSAAQISVSEVYNYCENEFIILTNGEPAVEQRAPPAEVLRHTFDNPPYRRGHFKGSDGWRGIAVMCLIRDIKNARSK
jgi:hypothetical protein